MQKLLHIVLKAASGQNSSDCVGRTFLTLQKHIVIFGAIPRHLPYKTSQGINISTFTFSYLLGFGWAQGDGNVSFLWASKIFAWTPMSRLIAGAVSIFVAVSLFQRASLSLAEETVCEKNRELKNYWKNQNT